MASRRANKLYNMMLKYRDETAIKKLKKAKKTDTDAMRARTFMSQRRPRQERESLWKLIKGKMKAKGSA